jgi:hypothetical protein
VAEIMTTLPSLSELFQRHTGRLIDKWDHYLPIYERYFSRFRERPIRLLEIGVSHGGSLQLWRRYFGEEAAIVGVDIDPRCQDYVEDGIDIEIGDQTDPKLWSRLIDKHVDFDIVIDDGSHVSPHQIATFNSVWPHLCDGGVYLVEDCHCAYWPEYGGGYRSPTSFIEFAKQKVDELNAFWSRSPELFRPTNFTAQIGGLHFHDSIVVFEKQLRMQTPTRRVTGELSHTVSEAAVAALMGAHIDGRSRS